MTRPKALPPLDLEHCDGCSQMFRRGTLRPVQVDPKAGLAGWQSLCRPCNDTRRKGDAA